MNLRSVEFAGLLAISCAITGSLLAQDFQNANPSHSDIAPPLPKTNVSEKSGKQKKIEQFVLRSAGSLPNEKTVALIAEKAEPFKVLPDGTEISLEEHILNVCGSIQPGYLAELHRANDPEKSIDLKASAGGVILPACLFATKESASKVVAIKNEGKSNIADYYTGFGRYVPKKLNEILSGRVLREGQPAGLNFITAPTILSPKPETDDFEETVETLKNVTIKKAKIGGRILGPTDKDCVSIWSNPAPKTEWESIRDAYPFAPAEVAKAFKHSLLFTPAQITRMAVFDNGFTGVPDCENSLVCPKQDANGSIDLRHPFPRPLFELHKYAGGIGPFPDTTFSPINYVAGIERPITTKSGHGTHIAGLTLGGPELDPFRSEVFGLPDSSWLKLAIASLSSGEREFPVEAAQTLLLRIQTFRTRSAMPDIANFSLELREGVSEDLESFRDRDEWRDTLFVAAAGNDTENVDEVGQFPAKLGGKESDNFITIASVDANGLLSDFTGHGKETVDLAAPGCKIISWITQEGEPVPASGTSQSAALVSFTGAMIKSILSDITPRKIKERLAYSGAMLKDVEDRSSLLHGTRLNIFMALMLRDDVVIARNPDRIIVGTIASQFNGLTTADGKSPKWQNVRAFKAPYDNQTYGLLFTRRGQSSLKSAKANLASIIDNSPNELSMNVRYIFSNGQFKSLVSQESIPAKDIIEIVRAELSLDN